jgi:ELWxxDGT repeat protein
MVLSFGVLLVGTAAAQTPITDIDTGLPIRYPSYITEYDNWMYFRGSIDTHTSDTQLWRSNGLYAEKVATGPGDPEYLAVHNSKLYFGAGSKLWQYDPIGGALVAPGSASNAQLPEEMTAYNGALYFRAARFGAPSNIGIELWKFDGTNQTPIDMFPGSGSSYPQHFIQYNGLLYFNACGTPGQGTELWRYNGVGMPTEAARIYPNNGSSPENFAIYNNHLYFSAYDGVHGRELWRHDGTTPGTVMAADIVPGGQYSSSNPNNLAVYNGKLYFCATDGSGPGGHGYELWSYDASTGTATMLPEINPTPNPGNGDDFLMDSSPANLTVFNGKLYFSADDGTHGRELWCFDGTETRMVLDINPGQYGSYVSELTVYNGKLYFAADGGYLSLHDDLQPAMMSLDVPEPGSLALLACAAAALLAWCARRRP